MINRLSSLHCRWIWLAGLSPLMFGTLISQDEFILDEIVAKVNQDVITLTDLKREIRLLRLSFQDEGGEDGVYDERFRMAKRALLKNLIRNRVMIQKADELGVTSNIDSEVETALLNMIRDLGIPSLEVFEQALKQRGTGLAEYRRNLRERLIIDYLVQQSVYSRITLLTPEIEAYYEEHKDRYAEPAEVKLAEILFLTEGEPRAQVRQLAEEMLSRLSSGESFEDLAREYSDGPTAKDGGDIGWFKKGSLAKQIEEVAFDLSGGDISSLIETGYGLQVVKILDRKESTHRPLEEVKPEIQRTLYRLKAAPEIKTFVDDLIQQSFIYVAEKYRAEYDVAEY